MPPTRLFLVHGMGEFGDEWAKDTKKQIEQLYSAYPKLSAVPVSQRFTFHPVRYDDVLSTLVAKWQKDANALTTLAAGVSATLVQNLVGWLQTAGKGFEWTHAADVLLYRCFADVREAVQVHVGRQIVEVVNKDLKAVQDCRWGVLGHSLGTAVTHDTLHALWTTPGAFDPADVKAAFVVMIANVSRVLETVNVLSSTVMPGTGTAATRGCLSFLTARHRLDPFTIPRMFDPASWPDQVTVDQGRYQSVRVQHFRDRNVHGLSHYLMHPSVHIPLFRMLADKPTIITKAEEQKALLAFPDIDLATFADGLKESQRLEGIQPSVSDDWKALRKIWDAFHGL